MTADQRLAAIRVALTDRWNDDGTAPDDFDILNDIQNILAVQPPTPEPLADTLPPGPIWCPSCAECAEWRSVERLTGTADLAYDEETNRFDYTGETDVDWNSQESTNTYECQWCGTPATPEIAAAIAARMRD